MEITRERVTEQRCEQNGDRQFSEPLERHGEWNNRSAQAGARNYWSELKPSALVNGNGEQIARGLGWFSIGLGLAEVAAPRALARFLGVKDQGLLLRVMGLREVATGVGILTQRRPAGWLWARVGGDIVDLAGLAMALASNDVKRTNIALATAAVAGVTALDVCCAQELSRKDGAATSRRAVRVTKAIMINRPSEELYRFWRNLQNLPRFMTQVESVQVTGEKRSHWMAQGPGGKRVEWDAEIVEERPNELVVWRSLEGADVPNGGSVRFEPAPGGRGTVVKVELQYNPPRGVIAATVAKLFGQAPEQQVQEDLRRFKQLIEIGEIITTEGQPAGRASSTSWKYDQSIRRSANPVTG
jgi:uncharacterized membrane protein